MINAAAYTAVNKAEEEQDITYAINRDGTANLAAVSKEKNILLLHISTDYVFDGTKSEAYSENDAVSPLGVYGISKWQGEETIRQTLPEHIILRVAWVFGEQGNNFVKTMLRLAKEKGEINVVSDQIGSPTYATDLAKVILQAIKYKNLKKENQITQIYHYSNEGKISWYEFAKEIFKIFR